MNINGNISEFVRNDKNFRKEWSTYRKSLLEDKDYTSSNPNYNMCFKIAKSDEIKKVKKKLDLLNSRIDELTDKYLDSLNQDYQEIKEEHALYRDVSDKELDKLLNCHIQNIRNHAKSVTIFLCSDQKQKIEDTIYNLNKNENKCVNDTVFKIGKLVLNKTKLSKYQKKLENSKDIYLSKGEKLVEEYLSTLNLNQKIHFFEKEKKFGSLRNHRDLRFDFFGVTIENRPFIIEYDGRQHWKTCYNKDHLETSMNDIIKEFFAWDNQINMLRIDYTFNKIDKITNIIDNFFTDISKSEKTVYKMSDKDRYEQKLKYLSDSLINK